MDILYTSFLQKLIQASNPTKIQVEAQDKQLLNLLTVLTLKVRESEALMRAAHR